MSGLPRGWGRVALAEVADVRLGKMLDQKRRKGIQRPYLRNINVRWLRVDTSDLLSMPFEPSELDRFAVENGDVLVCEGGEPGRSAVWRGEDRALMYQKAIHRVRFGGFLVPQWLVYHLLLDAQRGSLEPYLTGTTIKHFTGVAIQRYEFPVAPLSEQHRIVAALDSYLSRLDAAEAALRRARANLVRYRSSVLQAAVEGRLVPTEAELARGEGRGFEPASKLLERILVERRRRWEEAELAKMTAAGKVPKDDRWKQKYEEPAGPDVAALPALPEGWCWATVGQLAAVIGGLTKNASRSALSQKLPYLRVANVYAGRLELGEMKSLGVDESELDRALLERDDLLVVEGNGSLDQIGRVARWDDSISPCVHQNHIIKIRLIDTRLVHFVLTWLLSVPGRAQIVTVASSTAGLYNLSISKVSALAVPVPPLTEQSRMTSELELVSSVIDKLSPTVTTTGFRLTRLRQSILKWAFEGRLVDQDPDDEPASELLARIRALTPSVPLSRPTRKTTRLGEGEGRARGRGTGRRRPLSRVGGPSGGLGEGTEG